LNDSPDIEGMEVKSKQIKLTKLFAFKRIEGGALYYTIFIFFIVTLITGSLLLVNYHATVVFHQERLKSNTMDNVLSGIELFLARPENVPLNTSKEFQLFDSLESKVLIERKKWGCFDIVTSTSSTKWYRFSKTALVGKDIKHPENVAIYMTNREKYLSISGETTINGNAYLPEFGIKGANIEGRGYKGDSLVHGNVKKSNEILPPLEAGFVDFCKKYLYASDYSDDSLLNTSPGRVPLYNPFQNKPLLIYSGDDIILNSKITGHVIIRSDKAIYVTKDADTEDIILFAPSIYFEKGFNQLSNLKVKKPEALQLLWGLTHNLANRDK